MKTFIIAAAFAALLAPPALAQSYNPTYGTGNVSSPAAEINGGRDMAMPMYPNAATQSISAERLDGVRAEAAKKRPRRVRHAPAQ